MNISFSKFIKERAIARLGGPIIALELDDEQMQSIYTLSIINWDLYSSLSSLGKDKLKDIEGVWIENFFSSHL